MRTVYFDNAATTFPKPPEVIQAVEDALKSCGNPGRGSHKLSLKASELVYDCREAAAEMFSANAENVSFTMNATQSLNFAIKGLVNEGDHVIIDNLAHNASYRPLMAMCSAEYCSADVYDGLNPDSIYSKLKDNTSVIIATHQSNISSDTIDIEKIGSICRENGLKFIVDASQSAGHIPIDVKKMNITSLCMPGHKGLFGPMGVGLLISAPDTYYNTLIEGGAGVNSLDQTMPDELPERLEAGTVPLAAIAGLNAGIRFVNKRGIRRIHEHECEITDYIIRQLSKKPEISFYGSCVGPVFSFNIKGKSPSEIGKRLNDNGICVRTGYHCAPLAHKTLGSIENGSVRVSVSCLNRKSEAEVFVRELSRELRKI
ncbi:MAG: aminotransferase class V-fold PLP-dependent enzyme [Eubacteriales bacterium]